jgi:hypothetical protein
VGAFLVSLVLLFTFAAFFTFETLKVFPQVFGEIFAPLHLFDLLNYAKEKDYLLCIMRDENKVQQRVAYRVSALFLVGLDHLLDEN